MSPFSGAERVLPTIDPFARSLACALIAVAAPMTVAAELPLWELGLGAGVVNFPDYRGSDHRRSWLLPVPYVIYRGDFLRADREGIRGRLFDSERVELSLSLAAALPVDSSGNRARRGMPDLDPTVEFGPSLDIRLWRSADEAARLDLRLPLRWAFALGDGVDGVGLVFSPRLDLKLRDPLGHRGWTLSLLAGPIFTDRRNNAYYYEVSPAHATAGRPAWDASGGYAGTQFIAGLSKRYPRYWVGAFVRYDSLHGASFEDSPLMRRRSAWAAGFGVSWILGESSVRVASED